MMPDPSYRYLLSPHDLAALYEIADRKWSAIAWADPVRRAGLSVRCSEVRITAGETTVSIEIRSRELEPRVEAFRLTMALPGASPKPEWYKPPSFIDSDEIMSAFVGSSHRMFVAGRRFRFESERGLQSYLVEDVLLLRHSSGQQAFICADDELPGSLIVTRDRHSLPSASIDFAYLRAL